jgi:hypothetical protein
MRLALVAPAVVLAAVLVPPAPGKAQADGPCQQPVGLSLWFQDGIVRKQDLSPKTTMVIDGYARFIQELDVTASVTTTTDEGITPVVQNSDLSDLDWSGVGFVEEEWRPLNDGTTRLIRQRYYRGARWMQEESSFTVYPMDSHGHVVGPPLFANAGVDDDWVPSDDGFVRRFVARQVASPCNAVNDCSEATSYIAEALVQYRDSLHPDASAFAIPDSATQLGEAWSAEPGHIRFAPIKHENRANVQWGYGFVPTLTLAKPPANGRYFVAGETVNLQQSFFDSEGNRFFAPGSMPTYQDFELDQIPSGLRYYDGFREVIELYWAIKHREGNMLVDLAGPVDKLKYAAVTQPTLEDLFPPQTTFADAQLDGFTSIATLQPPALSELPPDDVNPVSDTIPFVLPANVQPGTYIAIFKARRDYGGEALNRVAQIELQVGQAYPSPPTQFTTGHCDDCHQGQSDFGTILHGVSDRRTCFGCHPQLDFEPDHALDCRVHTIHTRSHRFPGNPYDCSTCHLQQPTGPARCFPGDDIVP